MTGQLPEDMMAVRTHSTTVGAVMNGSALNINFVGNDISGSVMASVLSATGYAQPQKQAALLHAAAQHGNPATLDGVDLGGHVKGQTHVEKIALQSTPYSSEKGKSTPERS